MCEEKKPKINDRDVNALQIKKKKNYTILNGLINDYI